MSDPILPSGAGQIAVPLSFVQQVRLLVSDEPESNDLVEGREFSDPVLATHLVAILQDYNNTPPPLPFISFTELASPRSRMGQLRSYMFEAAAGRALKFGAIRGARNFMQYQSGSVNFNSNANWQGMAELGASMLREWDSRKVAVKIAINLEGGYSVAHSDLLNPQFLENNGIILITGGAF